MLIIFAGPPGTGKTTIARMLAEKLEATYLRIDSLEQALLKSGLVKNINDIGPAGYMAAYALAADNLHLGRTVIADSVNPLNITRDDWRQTAIDAKLKYLEVEIICSDKTEHRRRVDNRKPDIEDFTLPDWPQVTGREYHSWNRDHLIIDTAVNLPAQALATILRAMGRQP